MLFYRFPKQKIQCREGFFRKYKDEKSGFILSNALGTEKWIFDNLESQEKNIANLKWKKPTIVKKKDYLNDAKRTLDTLNNENLKKLVLSRIEAIPFQDQKSEILFHLMCETYPDAFIYYFDDPLLGKWIGASPEILLNKNHDYYTISSLAGTKLKDDDSGWTKKEIDEQKYVSNYIQSVVSKLNGKEIEIGKTYDYEAGPIKHIRTDFRLKISDFSIIDILNYIHPTPAVFGLPKEKSISSICNIENHDRELYSGYIGLITNRSCKIYVNIRCGRILDDHLYLFVGGGYTKDSNPEEEWQETQNKVRTYSNLINLL